MLVEIADTAFFLFILKIEQHFSAPWPLYTIESRF